MKKKIFLILFTILLATVLTGCVSKKMKQNMFDMLRDQGCIAVENGKFEEYDEEKSVNQAPIPMNIIYYR